MEAETLKKPDQEVIKWIEDEREGIVIKSKYDDDADEKADADDDFRQDAKSNNSAVFDPPAEEEIKAVKVEPIAAQPETDMESSSFKTPNQDKSANIPEEVKRDVTTEAKQAQKESTKTQVPCSEAQMAAATVALQVNEPMVHTPKNPEKPVRVIKGSSCCTIV